MPDALKQLQEDLRELQSAVKALQADVRRIRSALGTLCLVVNDSPHEKGPKLESVDLDSLDTFYMPATFCFDLSRKMDYIYLTMREFVEDANGEIASRVLSDNAQAYRRRVPWEESARITEEVFLKVLREIHDEHQRLLERSAR